MADFTGITTLIRTRNEAYSGMGGLPWVIINQNGFDRLNLRLWHQESTYGSCERGQSLLHSQGLPVGMAPGNISDANLDAPGNLHVRIGTSSTDLWLPELVFIYGRAGGRVVPLALTMDFGMVLSADPGEGVTTYPVRHVRLGDDTTVIRHLLFYATTMDVAHAETDDAIKLILLKGSGAAAVVHELPDTAQRDFERGTTGIYGVPVEKEFTRAELAGGKLRIEIDGRDKWIPNGFGLFGLDHAENPQAVVPLAFDHEPGPLSQDETEGTPNKELSIYAP